MYADGLHNLHCVDPQETRAFPRTLTLVAKRRERPEHTPETETVVVVLGEHATELVLDDGISLTFPRSRSLDVLLGDLSDEMAQVRTSGGAS